MNLISLLRRVTVDQWRAIDDETERTPGGAGRLDWRVLVACVTVAVSLASQDHFGTADNYQTLFPDDGSPYWELWGFAWWSGTRVVGYLVLPLIVIALMPGERLRDYHLSITGFTRHWWIYLVLYLVVLPLVLLASTTDDFRATYPFYYRANRSALDLWVWEGLYAAQFVALEFFFRGFLLKALRPALGANAVFVMVVPYCMIHFGKPYPETIGAIVTGLILGTLALRTKSIWGGVFVHIAVATTMDLLALGACPGTLPCHR